MSVAVSDAALWRLEVETKPAVGAALENCGIEDCASGSGEKAVVPRMLCHDAMSTRKCREVILMLISD